MFPKDNNYDPFGVMLGTETRSARDSELDLARVQQARWAYEARKAYMMREYGGLSGPRYIFPAPQYETLLETGAIE